MKLSKHFFVFAGLTLTGLSQPGWSADVAPKIMRTIKLGDLVRTAPPEVAAVYPGVVKKDTAAATAGLFSELKNPRSLNLDKIQKALDDGANVNAVDAERNTPLHFATANGNLGAVTMLLSKGAMANVANNVGNTPLHLAVGRADQESVRIIHALLNAHAKVNVANMMGERPLYLAWKAGLIGVVNVLSNAGADIMHVDQIVDDTAPHKTTTLEKIIDSFSSEDVADLLDDNISTIKAAPIELRDEVLGRIAEKHVAFLRLIANVLVDGDGITPPSSRTYSKSSFGRDSTTMTGTPVSEGVSYASGSDITMPEAPPSFASDGRSFFEAPPRLTKMEEDLSHRKFLPVKEATFFGPSTPRTERPEIFLD